MPTFLNTSENQDLIILTTIIIFTIGIPILMLVKGYHNFLKSESFKVKIKSRHFSGKYPEEVLYSSFPYYRELPQELKIEFIQRVIKFINTTSFFQEDDKEVNEERKILVAASAVQLTFGLPKISFDRFKTIKIHEKAYYNKLTHAFHKGEVNLKGEIVLSWEDFINGYANSHDKINLGLHEMAHALDLSLFLSQGRKYYLRRLMEHFQKTAISELLKIRTSNESTFRSYGGTNLREFFSVAVEHFFEDPQDFQSNLPELYYELCRILNQDPFHKLHRGFITPQNHQFKNQIPEGSYLSLKPSITIKPSWKILFPGFGIALFYIITIPFVINYLIKPNANYTILLGYFAVIMGYLGIKAKKLKLLGDYLIIKHNFWSSSIQSIHQTNILYVEFSYLLTLYELNIIYLEDEIVKEIEVPLYTRYPSIKRLQKELMKRDILVKQDQKWVIKRA